MNSWLAPSGELQEGVGVLVATSPAAAPHLCFKLFLLALLLSAPPNSVAQLPNYFVINFWFPELGIILQMRSNKPEIWWDLSFHVTACNLTFGHLRTSDFPWLPVPYGWHMLAHSTVVVDWIPSYFYMNGCKASSSITYLQTWLTERVNFEPSNLKLHL